LGRYSIANVLETCPLSLQTCYRHDIMIDSELVEQSIDEDLINAALHFSQPRRPTGAKVNAGVIQLARAIEATKLDIGYGRN
jgi:hypothetical protein